MLAALMITSTEDLDGSLSSSIIEPLKSLKRPWTVLTARCFTAKPTVEWTGSILYSSAAQAEPQTTRTTGNKPRTLRMRMRSRLLWGDGYLDVKAPHRIQEFCWKHAVHVCLAENKKPGRRGWSRPSVYT